MTAMDSDVNNSSLFNQEYDENSSGYKIHDDYISFYDKNDPTLRSDVQFDTDNKKMHVRHTQDVEPILESNKMAFDPDNKRFPGDGLHHVASIPIELLYKWAKEIGSYSYDYKGNKTLDIISILNDEKFLKRKLNDPENRFLRTKPGHI